MATFVTLITLLFRTVDLVQARFNHDMVEASETTKELVKAFADKLEIETPEVRVRSRSGMKSGGGKEMYGYAAPNPFGRDVVILNEVAETVLESNVDVEHKKDIISVVAHEVAHTGQRPQVSLIQTGTAGVPFVVAAVASLFTTSIGVMVGVAVLTAAIRKMAITLWTRRMEYDADVKAVQVAGADAVREYYGDAEPGWQPFSTSPSEWRRVNYLESKGLL